ncbi:polysaccharide pyruvyl transferase family protein [Palleronia sp. KMU-117]|uniref:polysaccharide pyruvyl transferase family protein n=1 Tax=Palleronia sp. KMU-117 TaxID=3434108 RepID=UPI003D744CE3
MSLNLVYYKSEPNVGDALNPWLWPKLLDGFVDDDPEHAFMGIGTILVDGYPPRAKRITVFGSGARSWIRLPDLSGPEWDFRFVRGPRTARLTGAKFISDPAVLLPSLLPASRDRKGIGFVPHFKTHPDTVAEAARRLNARIISPRLDVEPFVEALTGCEAVVCEAMHGAIIADAYRIPWAGVRLEVSYRDGQGNVFKWRDWSESLGITDRFARLPVICQAPFALRRRFMKSDWRLLDNLIFDLSPEGAVERAQDRIMDEVHALSRGAVRRAQPRGFRRRSLQLAELSRAR